MIIPGAQQGQRGADAGLTPRAGVHFHTGNTGAHETIDILLTQRSNIFVVDGSYNTTCTLPSVAEAGGMMFFFYITSGGGANLVITDNGDDPDFSTVTISTTNDAFILMSDGIHWFAFNAGDTS